MRILNFLAWLKPPEFEDNGETKGDLAYQTQMKAIRDRRWQWRMFWAVCGVVILGLGDQVVQWGVLPRVFGDRAFGGYAWASDVDKKVQAAVQPIQQDVTAIKTALEAQDRKDKEREIDDLKQQIFETRVAQCRAKAANVGSNPYTSRIGDLADKYQELTGRTYQLPLCDDL